MKEAEIIEIQHVIVDSDISWCNSEKFYGQGAEHGLVTCYPVNDGHDQLVIIISIIIIIIIINSRSRFGIS